METDLRNATVLITGASGGIGGATARAFAAEGSRLVLHYNTRRESAESLKSELDVPAIVVGGDLGDEDAVARLYDAAAEAFGPIDAVVANAGYWNPTAVPAHLMTIERWHEGLRSNLTSAFLTCREYLRQLAEHPRDRASIVLIGSTAAVFGEESHSDYSAAKAGLTFGLMRTLKNEIVRLAPLGRVNCVAPGWTAIDRPGMPGANDEAMRRVTSTMALRKIGQPGDVAAAVVFLTSHRTAGHLSGTVLEVAGGMEGRLLRSPDQ
jgi:3-oxoacyl-[acyl-carrier protein] reductase